MTQKKDIPRILVLDLAHHQGGASERAIGLLSCLPNDRCALASLEGAAVTSRARRLGLNVHCVGTHKLDPRIGRRLPAIISAGGFQIIDSQNPQSRFWGSFASARTGVVHVATLNSLPRKEYGRHFKSYLYQGLDKLAGIRMDYFIAVSAEIQNELLAAAVAPDKIALIPNGIAVETPVDSGNGSWLREEYGIPANIPVCCAVGRLAETKGYRYLIESIAIAENLGRRLSCLIVGEGKLDTVLKNQIKKLAIEDRVRLLGTRDHQEVLKIVHACDFFVMPSLSEGTPLALLEAACLGRPIVASDVGGIPDVVTNGENGLLVLPADVSALSKALLWMCAHPDKAADMGERAWGVVAERFGMQRVVDAVVLTYRRAIGLRDEQAGGPVV